MSITLQILPFEAVPPPARYHPRVAMVRISYRVGIQRSLFFNPLRSTMVSAFGIKKEKKKKKGR